MKRRLTQAVGSVVLCGAIFGASQVTFAQDGLSKQARKDVAWQAKMERDYSKLDRWLDRREAKRVKDQQRQEQRFGKFTARNSAVNYYTPGQSHIIGYFDRSNKFQRNQ